MRKFGGLRFLGSLCRLATPVIFSLFFASAAHADAIVTFNFSDQDADVDAKNSNLTVTDFVGGIGLIDVDYTAQNANARGWNPNTSGPNAIIANDFWTFTVTALAGFQFDLTDITLQHMRAQDGPVNIQVAADGVFITPIITVGQLAVTSPVPYLATDLTTITFHIAGWNASSNGNNQSELFLDNVVLNGTVHEAVVVTPSAVPEPATLLLLTTGLAAAAAHRGRQRRRA